MRKLSIADITNSAAMPMKSGSLEHIQLAYQEAIAASLKEIISSSYDPTIGYVLYGCENSGSGTTYTISEGAVFYNDEVFLVPSASLTTSGSNVVVAQIATTSYTGNGVNADPVNFTDGNTYNIHDIRQLNWVLGFSGSQEFNYSNAVFLKNKIKGAIGEIKMWHPLTGNISDYFYSSGLSNNWVTSGWAIANGSNGTIDMRGLVPVGYKSGDSDFGTLESTGGEKAHTLITEEQGYIDVQARGDDGDNITGTRISIQEMRFNGVGLNIPNDNWGSVLKVQLNDGGVSAHNNLQPYRTLLFIQRVS